MAGKSVYEQLLAAGVDPRDIRSAGADLHVRVTDESSAWAASAPPGCEVVRTADGGGAGRYEVKDGFAAELSASAAGECPSPEDLDAMAAAGVPLEDGLVLGQDDLVFAGEPFYLERPRPDDPSATERRWAYVTCYFEPASAGGPAWHCSVDLDYGFLSRCGNFPDCFGTAEEAIGCMRGYLGDGGLVEELGWRVSEG